MPHLEISRQNIEHYASLVHYYTIYDFARFEEEQMYLYLLCYVLQRYQQVNDNLKDALDFHVKKLEREVKESVKTNLSNEQATLDE